MVGSFTKRPNGSIEVPPSLVGGRPPRRTGRLLRSSCSPRSYPAIRAGTPARLRHPPASRCTTSTASSGSQACPRRATSRSRDGPRRCRRRSPGIRTRSAISGVVPQPTGRADDRDRSPGSTRAPAASSPRRNGEAAAHERRLVSAMLSGRFTRPGAHTPKYSANVPITICVFVQKPRLAVDAVLAHAAPVTLRRFHRDRRSHGRRRA